MRSKLILIFCFGLLISCSREKPAEERLRSRRVIIDNAYLLTEAQKDSISHLILTLEKKIGSQIAIVTIVSLDGQKIEDFSLATCERLRLGRSTHNDGVLITVALADQIARIEVGLGLENIITDEISARLLREIINPNFVAEKYGPGLYYLVDSISMRIMDHKDIVGQEPRWK
jgi:uncharacterized membrane protein YgcG